MVQHNVEVGAWNIFKADVIRKEEEAWNWWLLQDDTKKGNFWKTQQKLKKSKKKNLLTEIEPLQLAF